MRGGRLRMKHLLIMYGLDLLIVLLAIGAAVMANLERTTQPFGRLLLLLPGLLAFAGTLILLTYPDIRDLAAREAWLVGAAGMVIGGVRGWTLTIGSDRIPPPGAGPRRPGRG